MRGIFIPRHGDLDTLRFGDVLEKALEPDHVRVEMRAAALNHLDLFVLGGLPGLELEMPHVLGSDGAGVVNSVGSQVETFSPGDRVMLNPVLSCGTCEYCAQGQESLCIKLRLVGEHCRGTYAERFQVPAANLLPIPEQVTFEEAAAFSLAYQTAWRMLQTRARIQPGEDVFIHGIGGGVSTAALQIVTLFGGRAFVSSSSDEKLKRALELGAHRAYNYTNVDVTRSVLADTGKRGVDIVVENVGAATWLASLKMVRKGGRIVTCGATTGPNPQTEIRLIFWKQVDILGSTMSSRQEYRDVVDLLAQGKLKPVVDRTFPLAEARQALEYLSAQRQLGKVVLVPSGQ